MFIIRAQIYFELRVLVPFGGSENLRKVFSCGMRGWYKGFVRHESVHPKTRVLFSGKAATAGYTQPVFRHSKVTLNVDQSAWLISCRVAT